MTFKMMTSLLARWNTGLVYTDGEGNYIARNADDRQGLPPEECTYDAVFTKGEKMTAEDVGWHTMNDDWLSDDYYDDDEVQEEKWFENGKRIYFRCRGTDDLAEKIQLWTNHSQYVPWKKAKTMPYRKRS